MFPAARPSFINPSTVWQISEIGKQMQEFRGGRLAAVRYRLKRILTHRAGGARHNFDMSGRIAMLDRFADP
jgi:hypothetical protein